QHLLRRPDVASQQPFQHLPLPRGARYSRAADSAWAWTPAIVPSSDGPTARCASFSTSTSPNERKLTLHLPFASRGDKSSSPTPAAADAASARHAHRHGAARVHAGVA